MPESPAVKPILYPPFDLSLTTRRSDEMYMIPDPSQPGRFLVVAVETTREMKVWAVVDADGKPWQDPPAPAPPVAESA